MRSLAPLRRFVRPYRRRQFLENRIAARFGPQSSWCLHIFGAITNTTRSHAGEGRRKNDESKLVHEREIAGSLEYYGINDPVMYVGCFTHDRVEDYRHKGWTFIAIRRLHGRLVDTLTRAMHKAKPKPGLSLDDLSFITFCVRLVRGGKRAVTLKCLDRLHNFMNPWSGGCEKMVFKIQQTRRYLIPLARRFKVQSEIIADLELAMVRLEKIYGLCVLP